MLDLLTAGIGLIGSLFGGGDTKTEQSSESTSTSSIDYKAMVDAATSAGFNPLTAIRTGGASGFVTTNTKSKGESTTSSGPNWGGVADAVGGIAGSVMRGMNNAADPIASSSSKKGRAISTALVDSQLRGAQKRPAGALYSAGQTIGTKVSSNAPSLRNQSKASSKANKPGEGTLVGGDNPTVSSLGLNNGKYGWFHYPGFPDGQVFEDVYGDAEVPSTLFWIGKGGLDTVYSGYRNLASVWQDGKEGKFDGYFRVKDLPPKQASKSKASWMPSVSFTPRSQPSR